MFDYFADNFQLKTVKTTLIIATVFLLLWTPYNIVALWQTIDEASYQPYEDSIYVLYSLVVLNSVVNPFIYGRFH